METCSYLNSFFLADFIHLPNRFRKHAILKKISLQDISESLGISKSTISSVLNGRGDEKRVSKETQEKIISFAKEHNYKPNLLARGLSRGKSDMIGLVVPNISDIFFARIARRIEEYAEQSGYNVVFSSTGESKERESQLIQSMLDRQVDGLIIASCQKNDKDILRLKNRNFPFVLIDRHYPEINTHYVGIDNVGGVASAVERLIHTGRKRIALVTLSIGLEPIRERSVSYQKTLRKHGIQFDKDLIHALDYQSMETDMQDVIKALIVGPNKVEGIVFATHFLTAYGLREIKKLPVSVPEDVALVSLGQMSAFDLMEPPVTSVALPSSEIGDKAVDILLRNMLDTNLEYEKISLKTELVVRRSCGNMN